MIKKIALLSLFFLNSTMIYSMASKARAIATKLPVVSALAAAQLYKEYDDRNNEMRDRWNKNYGTTQLDTVNDYPRELLGKFLGYSDTGTPTAYIQDRVEKRLKGKIPDLSKVHIVRSNRQGIGRKNEWYKPDTLLVPATRTDYAAEHLGDFYLGITEDPRVSPIESVEHEISHIERMFLMKFTNWYKEHGQKLYIPAAIDACLIVTGLRKTIALGAVTLAHSFHEQMSNLISRYTEQDADDHVPDEHIFLEDGIRFFTNENSKIRPLYEDALKNNKSQEDTFLSLCELLDQFPLCEDKKWGYSLWQIIKVDPHHPPVNIRLEKFKKRLDLLNEIKEEEIEDFWMVD